MGDYQKLNVLQGGLELRSVKFCVEFTQILIKRGSRIEGLTDLIVLLQEFLQIFRRSFHGWMGWGSKTTTSTWSTLSL